MSPIHHSQCACVWKTAMGNLLLKLAVCMCTGLPMHLCTTCVFPCPVPLRSAPLSPSAQKFFNAWLIPPIQLKFNCVTVAPTYPAYAVQNGERPGQWIESLQSGRSMKGEVPPCIKHTDCMTLATLQCLTLTPSDLVFRMFKMAGIGDSSMTTPRMLPRSGQTKVTKTLPAMLA